MSKPPPPRRRHLSKEDQALWEHTAESLKPLREKKGRHHPAATGAEDAKPFASKIKAATKAGHVSKAQERLSVKKPPPSSPPSQMKMPPALNAFDRKAARRLRQGQIEIEARIDLHGMRQHEAHTALRRFLLSCVARRLRWVLVITGKGGPRRPQDDDPWQASERGVLRKNVPMWLSEPELRAVVVSFKAAAIPHGGDGALYIQLRNPERTRS